MSLPKTYYQINRWDNAAWRSFAKRKTKRGAVKAIRKLQSMGYDRDTSISAEKITPGQLTQEAIESV